MRSGFGRCSALPDISATPVTMTTSDNFATKLASACGSGAGILEMAAGTYTDFNAQIGDGGVAIAGECEIRGANPADKPLLRAGVDVARAILQVRNVDYRMRFTNLHCDGRRGDQTEASYASICADTSPADGVCDSGEQTFSDLSCIDSRSTEGGILQTCVYGVDSEKTVFDGIFLRNQDGSAVESSTVDGAGCDSTLCPNVSGVPADNSLGAVLNVARGINLVNADNSIAVDNVINAVTKQGVQCFTSDNCNIVGNTVTRFGITGITMLGSTGVVIGNDVDNIEVLWTPDSTTSPIGQGILLTDGANFTDFKVYARNNTVSNAWGDGIAASTSPSSPTEPEVIIEQNTIEGACTGSTSTLGASLLLGDNTSDFESIVSRNNTITGNNCDSAKRVRNAPVYSSSGDSISGTVSGDAVEYDTVVINESSLTVDADINIDASSSGTLSGCTLNGIASVNDSSGGAVTRSGGC